MPPSTWQDPHPRHPRGIPREPSGRRLRALMGGCARSPGRHGIGQSPQAPHRYREPETCPGNWQIQDPRRQHLPVPGYRSSPRIRQARMPELVRQLQHVVCLPGPPPRPNVLPIRQVAADRDRSRRGPEGAHLSVRSTCLDRPKPPSLASTCWHHRPRQLP